MICVECGTTLADGSQFCNFYGQAGDLYASVEVWQYDHNGKNLGQGHHFEMLPSMW